MFMDGSGGGKPEFNDPYSSRRGNTIDIPLEGGGATITKKSDGKFDILIHESLEAEVTLKYPKLEIRVNKVYGAKLESIVVIDPRTPMKQEPFAYYGKLMPALVAANQFSKRPDKGPEFLDPIQEKFVRYVQAHYEAMERGGAGAAR